MTISTTSLFRLPLPNTISLLPHFLITPNPCFNDCPASLISHFSAFPLIGFEDTGLFTQLLSLIITIVWYKIPVDTKTRHANLNYYLNIQSQLTLQQIELSNTSKVRQCLAHLYLHTFKSIDLKTSYLAVSDITQKPTVIQALEFYR